MPSTPSIRRATHTTALVTTVIGLATLLAGPAHAAQRHTSGLPAECSGTTSIVCHFDVPPGNYTVSALLGGRAAGSTSVFAETRRAMLPETSTAAGRVTPRSFTVNVRDPEGEPTGPTGSPGLDLRFEGSASQVAGLKVTPARRVPKLLLAGDSTVCDQAAEPYTGWGQEITQFLRRGVSIANYADSGESSQTFVDNPALFDALEAQIRKGDLVLIQLAHNDKTTTAADYRRNLTTMAQRVRAKGGEPVFVTPIVRRRFNSDGTLNSVALHVMAANLPVEMRSLAAELDVPLVDLTAMTQGLVESLGPAGSGDLYLTNINGDNTHTSVYGATTFAGLVLEDLKAQGLLPAAVVR
ncbi:rhamnogalacturonan acetylesterase [Streptomyces longispororuber]|uniref:rhamnogalacturonan acetylesterase n=1 Tax=Streptomyces longispororuber TaxID=68230 RepID=UPI0021092038|nr:rhamnogalacturonan acetylesterase [Streptomyces longispororuber]MCQ4210757.1 rhamnogalacturonan acetylesterase [Streptomyces longispororuber]